MLPRALRKVGRGRPDPGYTDGYAHRITEAGNPNATFEKTIVCIGGVPSDSSHTFFWVAKYLLRLDKTVRCIIIHLPYCEEETIPTPTYPDTVRARYLPQVAPFNVDDITQKGAPVDVRYDHRNQGEAVYDILNTMGIRRAHFVGKFMEQFFLSLFSEASNLLLLLTKL